MVTGRKIVWHMFSSLSAPVSFSKKGFREAARDMMQKQWHVCAVPQTEKAYQAERRESRAACNNSGRPPRGKETDRHRGRPKPPDITSRRNKCSHASFQHLMKDVRTPMKKDTSQIMEKEKLSHAIAEEIT